MFARIATLVSAGLVIGIMMPPPGAPLADSPKAVAAANGLVQVKSAYAMDETVARLKADIAKKGIAFFAQIDQDKLAAAADIKIGPSVLGAADLRQSGARHAVHAAQPGIRH